MKNKPCPFCRSTDLSENLWSLESGEAEAIECNNCLSGALKVIWNSDRRKRGKIQLQKIIKFKEFA